MVNNYVGSIVEEFHSDADMGFVCEFLMDCIEDDRYTNYPHSVDSTFEVNMMNFIYGVGQ